jgi:hypothetical protein
VKRAIGDLATTRGGRVALALVALALAIRLVAAVAVCDDPLAFDARDYDRHARSIATGNGYAEAFAPYEGPTAYRPPGFPAFLAAIYAVRGGVEEPPDWRVYLEGYQPDPRQANAGRVGQAVLGTAVVALIGLVALQLFGGRVALIATGIAAVYPPFVILGLSLFSEPLFVAFVLAALAAALRARAAPARAVRWAALAGAFAGLAWLTRSNGFVVVAGLAILVWTLTPRLSRRGLAAPVALVAAAVLVIAPWTIRNAVVLDAFFPVSSEAGYTLAGTYNETSAEDEDYRAGWIPPEQDPHNEGLIRRVRDEPEFASTMSRSTREYVADHPGYPALVAYCNTMRMVYLERLGCGESGFGKGNFEHETGVGTVPVAMAIAAFALLVLLAAAGATTRAARAAPRALWLLPVFLATVILVVSGNRLRAPIDVFLVLLAALALARLADRLRSRTA